MFQKDGLTYYLAEAKQEGFIAIQSYNGLVVEDRMTFSFSTEKEIEELQEVTKIEKYIDKEIQEIDGVDTIVEIIKTREVTETVKTGKMIPNENYCEPTIEAIIKFVEKKLI